MAQTIRQLLMEAGNEVSVFDYLDSREYLHDVYQYVKGRQRNYSYVKFAQDVGYGKTNKIGLVIRGQRSMKLRSARLMADALALKGETRRYFLKLVEYTHERRPAEREKILRTLMDYKASADDSISEDVVRYFSDWYVPVIRELISYKDFDPDPEWIRKTVLFPLHKNEIKEALASLLDMGYIKFNWKKERFERASGTVMPPVTADHMVFVRYQQRMMEIAKDSLTRVDDDLREVSCITAALGADSFNTVKGKIKELLDEVERLEAADADKQRVYQLNVQLFPFSRESKE